MRKCLMIAVLSVSLAGWAQWEKQGTVLGNITDTEVIQLNGTAALMYAATDGSGVFKSTDAVTWVPVNGTGTSILPDLHIKAIAAIPGWPNYLVAISDHGVYRTPDQGATWAFLQGPTPNLLPKDFPFEDIAVASYLGQLYYYLATYGGGVYCKIMGNDWLALSTGFETGDTYVISIGANEDRILAGTTLHLYWQTVASSQWVKYIDSMGFPSFAPVRAISYRHPEYAIVALGMMPVGGIYGGLFYTTDVNWGAKPNFYALNPSGDMPTNEEFISIDTSYLNPAYVGAAGTRDHLYRIPDPVTNTGTYTALAFRGPVKGLSLGRGGASSDFKQAFFGGPGKGPFRANLGALTQRPTPIRSGMQDWQVSDIGASTQYSNSTDWEVFTASSVNGLFKNQEAFDAQTGAQGYFTRMIGATARDGVPEVNCLVLSPVYKQGGSIGDAELTLFAGTEGEGVLRSSDGGRSWFAPDTGSTKPLPTASRVKALLISPAFATDQTLWAAVISGSSNTTGVYVSTSGGLNWSLLTTSGPPLGNFNMTSLALHPDFPTAAALYLGCGASGTANTVWRYDGALWTAVGSMTHPVTSLSATKYLGNLRIFAGTEDDGVHYWSGSTWTAYNSALTGGRFISGLKASPNFAVDHTLIAAVRPAAGSGSGGFCWIQFPASTWTGANGGLPADLRLQSVAFAPNYSASNIIFCGSAHSGVYSTRMTPGAPPDYDWQGAAGFYTTPKKVNGLAVDPGDSNFVLAATDDSGVMVSLDGGFTFRPWSRSLTYTGGDTKVRPVPQILSVVVTKPLSGTSRRAVCGTAGYGMYYVDYDPNASDRTSIFYYPQWHASAVPGPVPPTYGKINEIRYVWETVLLNETFEGTIFPPAGWSRSNGGGGGKGLSWVRANSTTPAATGCAPRPVGSPLTGWVALMDSYCDGSGATQNDWLITPALSMESVSSLTLEFDHRYEFWDIPSSEIAEVRVSRPSQGGGYYLVQSWTADRGPIHETIDLTGFMEEGMRVAFRYQGAYDEYWMIDNVKITMNKNEAMRASDTSNGDFFSDNYGATWSQSTGIPAGVGLTDINYLDGGYLPNGRGRTGFVWGCSSGKSLAFRASCTGTGKAWKYDPLAATWAACPTIGLDTCEDYRAILKLSNGTLFMGSKGIGDASSWTGLWRSEDDCATWTSAIIPDLGFPTNPQVYALQELDNGDILAGLDGASGGVYMSDAVSGGRAWVQVNRGFSPAEVGTVDLAGGGGRVYTGMSADGIYASDTVIPYADAPEAYFECAAEACVNSPVSFTDRSAGRVNAWSWSFGDSGSSSLQNPAHTYAVAGTYSPQLTASNGYSTDTHSRTVQVGDELEVSIRLNKGKVFSAGFEPGSDGFTPTGLWHRSTACGAATTVYYYGQEGTCNYSTGAANSGTLTAPSISLVNIGTTLSLSFRYLLQTEEAPNYDKATVEISTNGGGTWTILDRDDVNGGTLVTDNAWHTASINLSAYAGNTVLVRFAFNTVDAANNTFKGFMVDDAAVAASASEIYAAWNDIAGETGYQIYRSDSPSSRTADATLGACSASTCATTLPAGYTYYRIQVKSTSYACGDGPIGGSW